MANSRKQVFERNQRLVLMRDLRLKDLHFTTNPQRNPKIVSGGKVVTFLEPGEREGNVRVQFDADDFDSREISGTGIRDDGRWSIDADLLQPYYNPAEIQPGSKFVSVPFTQLFMSLKEIPAGVVFTNISSNPGVNTAGDIRVEYQDKDTGKTQGAYVHWYNVLPFVEPVSKQLWGKYDMGKIHSFDDGKEIMVVAVRNVGRSELSGNVKNMSAEEREISEQNKLFMPQGQVGYVNLLNLTDDYEGQQARVWHFDHCFKREDYWNVSVDTVVPLLNHKTGQPMTLAEYTAAEDSDKYLRVGFQATISAPVMIVTRGEITTEIDWRFRDDDKVYILEVDKTVDLDDLVYKVGFSEDGSGPTTWVRQIDLYESPEDQD